MACRDTNWQSVTDECSLPSYELLRWFGRFEIALLATSAEGSAISFLGARPTACITVGGSRSSCAHVGGNPKTLVCGSVSLRQGLELKPDVNSTLQFFTISFIVAAGNSLNVLIKFWTPVYHSRKFRGGLLPATT